MLQEKTVVLFSLIVTGLIEIQLFFAEYVTSFSLVIFPSNVHTLPFADHSVVQ